MLPTAHLGAFLLRSPPARWPRDAKEIELPSYAIVLGVRGRFGRAAVEAFPAKRLAPDLPNEYNSHNYRPPLAGRQGAGGPAPIKSARHGKLASKRVRVVTLC